MKSTKIVCLLLAVFMAAALASCASEEFDGLKYDKDNKVLPVGDSGDIAEMTDEALPETDLPAKTDDAEKLGFDPDKIGLNVDPENDSKYLPPVGYTIDDAKADGNGVFILHPKKDLEDVFDTECVSDGQDQQNEFVNRALAAMNASVSSACFDEDGQLVEYHTCFIDDDGCHRMSFTSSKKYKVDKMQYGSPDFNELPVATRDDGIWYLLKLDYTGGTVGSSGDDVTYFFFTNDNSLTSADYFSFAASSRWEDSRRTFTDICLVCGKKSNRPA